MFLNNFNNFFSKKPKMNKPLWVLLASMSISLFAYAQPDDAFFSAMNKMVSKAKGEIHRVNPGKGKILGQEFSESKVILREKSISNNIDSESEYTQINWRNLDYAPSTHHIWYNTNLKSVFFKFTTEFKEKRRVDFITGKSTLSEEDRSQDSFYIYYLMKDDDQMEQLLKKYFPE